MMMMMMSITDNRCSVCRGEASTSTAQCQCPAPTDRSPSSSTRCINCGVLTASSLCARCKALPRCRRCKRHLPKRCFLQVDGDGDDQEDDGNVNDSSEAIDKRSAVCRTCDKKRSRSTVRKSTGNIVTEIEMPTTDAVHRSFESLWRAWGLSQPTRLRLQSQPRHLRAVLPCLQALSQGPPEEPGPPQVGAVS